MQETTIAAIATAPGAGGIAVVRLSGAQSYAVAERVFRPANPGKKVAQAKGYTALFGHFVDGGEKFDEGVALFFRAPHSYTGEDVVELSCHGGNAVARRLVEACLAAGAQPAAPGEYTRRAFLNGKLGLTQAEAVMDLISADGRQGAALANAALGGALGIALGYAVSMAANKVLPMFMSDTAITVSASFNSIVVAFGISVGIGVLFGYLPAKRAARLNPIEALRYD